MSDNDSQHSQAFSIDDSDGKCPICYMIFPSSMSAKDRHQHAGEHY